MNLCFKWVCIDLPIVFHFVLHVTQITCGQTSRISLWREQAQGFLEVLVVKTMRLVYQQDV